MGTFYSIDQHSAEAEILKWSRHWGIDTQGLDGLEVGSAAFAKGFTDASISQQLAICWPDRGELLEPLRPAELREVAKSSPWGTCTGCDIHPRHLSLVTDSALTQLAML